MWDTVPWMVGGNVKHSTNVARLLAYAAFGGQEGIISPKDLEVRERAVPAGSIRVMPGACCILNRAANIEYEAYAGRLPSEDYLDIPATGSGGWRTDLIVARVENPFLTGEPYAEPTPADVAAGNVQFVFTRVIPSVRSGASGVPEHPTAAQVAAAINGMSAIPLASIAIPASTGTITQALIKDLRFISQFREAQVMRVVKPSATITLSDATWRDIALAAIEVPEWATHFSARTVIGGAQFTQPQSVGNLRLMLGTTPGTQTAFDVTTDKATDKITLMGGANKIAIPAAMRGTTQNIKAQGQKSSGTNMVIGSTASVSLDVVFHTQPEANV